MQFWTTKKAFVAISLALTSSVVSAAYPDKPITLVVGFSPGGTADSTARILAESMGPLLGQTIIVDRSEEHTSELQSLMRISYAVFCLKQNNHYLHMCTLLCSLFYT